MQTRAALALILGGVLLSAAVRLGVRSRGRIRQACEAAGVPADHGILGFRDANGRLL